MDLAALQRSFLAAMAGHDTALQGQVRPGIAPTRPPTPAARIQVYRNAVRGNQREAMAAVYPVVQALVGQAFFNEAADQCLFAHPSTSGDLHDLGAELPGFLREYSHAETLPWLGDVAALEWALHRAFHAADAQPIEVTALAQVQAEDMDRLILLTAPGVALIDSGWPIQSIWRAHLVDMKFPDPFDPDQGGECVLVYREGFECVAEVLDAPRAALVAACLADKPLVAALETATFRDLPDPGATLMAGLHDLFSTGIFCGTRIADMVE